MLLLNKDARYKFLNDNGGGFYMVKYGGNEEPLYFSCHGDKDSKWWLEAPCDLRKFDGYDLNNKEDLIFIKEYGMLIYNEEVWEIDLPQAYPFLPKHVEMEKITESECLEWLVAKFEESTT